MKKHILTLFLILFIAGCQSINNQQDQVLYFKGIQVSESVPDFLHNDQRVAARGAVGGVQLDQTLPYGTVYGCVCDPDNVYLAQGGETLPPGTWSDQLYQDNYTIHVSGNTSVAFNTATTIEIQNPLDTYYQDSDGNWSPVLNNSIVQSTGIKTGQDSSCSLTINILCNVGPIGDDDENQD